MQQRVIKQVEQFFHSAFLESKTQFDKKVAIREFPLGCKVFVFSTQRGLVSKKLHKPYKGPYICVGHAANNNLVLRLPSGTKLIHVHKNSCKLGYWRHTAIQLWDSSPPEPLSQPAQNPPDLLPFLDDDDLPLPFVEDIPPANPDDPAAPNPEPVQNPVLPAEDLPAPPVVQ